MEKSRENGGKMMEKWEDDGNIMESLSTQCVAQGFQLDSLSYSDLRVSYVS